MDFITDHSGRHVLNIERTLRTIPDFVKTASIDPADTQGLAIQQFALPGKREFPIDNPAHVFLSYAYCKSAGIEDAALLGTLKVAATKFGIAQEIVAIDEDFATLEKKAAAADPQFAVWIDFGPGDAKAESPFVKAGGVKGFYPMHTHDELTASAIQLANERTRIPLDCFVDGCRSLMKRASELNVARRMMPRIVDDYGTRRLPNFDFLTQQAANRARETGDEIYNEIAKTACANPESIPADDFIGLWKQADDQNGVAYTKTVWDPYRLFNSGITEEDYQAGLEKWALVGNAPVPREAIAQLDPEKATRFFSKAAAQKVTALIKGAATATGTEVSRLLLELDEVSQNRLLKLLTG